MDIFEHVYCVMVWLNPAQDDTHLAFHKIRQVTSILPDVAPDEAELLDQLKLTAAS
jgi:hypothetical protein